MEGGGFFSAPSGENGGSRGAGWLKAAIVRPRWGQGALREAPERAKCLKPTLAPARAAAPPHPSTGLSPDSRSGSGHWFCWLASGATRGELGEGLGRLVGGYGMEMEGAGWRIWDRGGGCRGGVEDLG